tara:strand:+ start:9601 stop:9906 length:306 start_codon:yes stop_codon:yes gene_type:complete
MKRFIIAAVFASLALLPACSAEPKEPSPREQACETFKSVSPGFYELSWAMKTLTATDSPDDERIEAIRTSLDYEIGRGRTEPYTCDEPAFERYLTEKGIEN